MEHPVEQEEAFVLRQDEYNMQNMELRRRKWKFTMNKLLKNTYEYGTYSFLLWRKWCICFKLKSKIYCPSLKVTLYHFSSDFIKWFKMKRIMYIVYIIYFLGVISEWGNKRFLFGGEIRYFLIKSVIFRRDVWNMVEWHFNMG